MTECVYYVGRRLFRTRYAGKRREKFNNFRRTFAQFRTLHMIYFTVYACLFGGRGLAHSSRRHVWGFRMSYPSGSKPPERGLCPPVTFFCIALGFRGVTVLHIFRSTARKLILVPKSSTRYDIIPITNASQCFGFRVNIFVATFFHPASGKCTQED